MVQLAAMKPEQFVDTKRYPIDRPDSPEAKSLVRELRATLDETGACRLAGFVRPEIADAMAAELEALSTRATRGRSQINPYEFDTEIDAEAVAGNYPEGHPRRRLLRRNFSVLAYRDIAEQAGIRRLYWWDALPPFLAGILGLEQIYRFDDEFQSINVLYMPDGGEQQWHFDSNDFSVTVMLQKPAGGGAFQYAPNIRAPGKQNYDAVAKLLDGDRSGNHVVTVPLDVGDLMIFRGKYSMHRATPVTGDRTRILSVLCFDVAPGQSNLAVTNQRHYTMS